MRKRAKHFYILHIIKSKANKRRRRKRRKHKRKKIYAETNMILSKKKPNHFACRWEKGIGGGEKCMHFTWKCACSEFSHTKQCAWSSITDQFVKVYAMRVCIQLYTYGSNISTWKNKRKFFLKTHETTGKGMIMT